MQLYHHRIRRFVECLVFCRLYLPTRLVYIKIYMEYTQYEGLFLYRFIWLRLYYYSVIVSEKKLCSPKRTNTWKDRWERKKNSIWTIREQYLSLLSPQATKEDQDREYQRGAVVQYTRDTCQYGSFSLAPALPRDHPARAIKNSRGFRMEGYLDSPALWRYRARKREPSLWPRTLFIWPLLSQNLSLSAHWLIVSSTPSNSPCTFLPSCSFERGYNI